MEVRPLAWNGPLDFNYPGMVRIATDGDGSCFFHAILKMLSNHIRMGLLNDYPINRREVVKSFRTQLAQLLMSPSDEDPGKTYYEYISRGKLPHWSKEMPCYTLEYMQGVLMDGLPVDNAYNEFVSEVLGVDLYLLDGEKRDVYITGNDDELLYKGRGSIVVLYGHGHYEGVGLVRRGVLDTLFAPQDDFIVAIRERMRWVREGKRR